MKNENDASSEEQAPDRMAQLVQTFLEEAVLCEQRAKVTAMMSGIGEMAAAATLRRCARELKNLRCGR
jgi:hypothetical protein